MKVIHAALPIMMCVGLSQSVSATTYYQVTAFGTAISPNDRCDYFTHRCDTAFYTVSTEALFSDIDVANHNFFGDLGLAFLTPTSISLRKGFGGPAGDYRFDVSFNNSVDLTQPGIDEVSSGSFTEIIKCGNGRLDCPIAGYTSYFNIKTASTPFGPSRITSMYGGYVPEPASWAMMLCGFGAIGTAIRVKRRASFA